MQMLARAALVAVMSIGIALGLSVLPQPEQGADRPGEQSVFRPDHPKSLTPDNLVDGLIRLPLSLAIAKADLQQSELAVDLWFPGGLAGSQTVYHDLYELSQFAWRSTSNVERIQIRVLDAAEKHTAGPQLLLAMEGRRSEGLGASSQDAERLNIQEYLQNRYKVTYTQKWKDLY